MSGIFEELEMFDEGDKLVTRQAIAAANKRFEDNFGKFLRQASTKKEFESRLALVDTDINNMVTDIVNEYGGDASKIASAIKTTVASTHVAKCDNCGDHGCESCGAADGRPEHLKAQDKVQIADEHSQVPPWLTKQEDGKDQEDGGNRKARVANDPAMGQQLTNMGTTPYLQQGSTGNDVKAIQKQLGINADGIYGPQTAQAVKDYQAKNNLTADGIVGNATQRHLVGDNYGWKGYSAPEGPMSTGPGGQGFGGQAEQQAGWNKGASTQHIAEPWYKTITQGIPELVEGAGDTLKGVGETAFGVSPVGMAYDVAKGQMPGSTFTEGVKDVGHGLGQIGEGTWDSTLPGMAWNLGIQHGKGEENKENAAEQPAEEAPSTKEPAPHTPPVAGGGKAPWNPFDADQPTYGVGDSGKQVEQIQQHLINSGYMTKGADDGQFGQNTEAALRKFQQDKGLTADGTFGQQTLRAFQGQAGEKAAPNVAPGAFKNDPVDNDMNRGSSTHVAAPPGSDPWGFANKPSQTGKNGPTMQTLPLPANYKPTAENLPLPAGAKSTMQNLNLEFSPEAQKMFSDLQNDLQNPNQRIPGTPIPDGPTVTPGGKGDKNPFAGQGGSTLAVGSEGTAVKSLQQTLNQLNPGADIKVDGQFGAETQKALQNYQKANNLTVDGIAGAQTAGSMLNNLNDRSVYAVPKPGEITKGQGAMPNEPQLPPTVTPGKPVPFGDHPFAIQPTAASVDTGDSTEGRESLPKGNEDAHDGPSPKMDKKEWKPNATNPKGNLKPIETEGDKSPHPTHHQDIKQKPDYQNDDAWKHDNNVWKREDLPSADDNAGFDGTRNIDQPTKAAETFPDKGQTNPVTRESLSNVQRFAIYEDERDILENNIPSDYSPKNEIVSELEDLKHRLVGNGISPEQAEQEIRDLVLGMWRTEQSPEDLESIGIQEMRGPFHEESNEDEFEEIIERGDSDEDRVEVDHKHEDEDFEDEESGTFDDISDEELDELLRQEEELGEFDDEEPRK